MLPWKSYDCTGALAGVLLRDRGCVCEGGEWDFCLRASLSGFGFRVADGPRRRGSADRCGDGELEAGCGALVALLLAPLAQNWATPILAMVNLHCCLHLMSAHGSATANASVMAPSPFAVKLSVGAVGGGGGGRRRRCSLAGGGAVGGRDDCSTLAAA